MTDQAAASPNTAFSGTAMAATRSVRRMAASASGSANDAHQSATPSFSASVTTAEHRHEDERGEEEERERR